MGKRLTLNEQGALAREFDVFPNLDEGPAIECMPNTIEDVRKALGLPKGIHKTDEEIWTGIRKLMQAKHGGKK